MELSGKFAFIFKYLFFVLVNSVLFNFSCLWIFWKISNLAILFVVFKRPCGSERAKTQTLQINRTRSLFATYPQESCFARLLWHLIFSQLGDERFTLNNSNGCGLSCSLSIFFPFPLPRLPWPRFLLATGYLSMQSSWVRAVDAVHGTGVNCRCRLHPGNLPAKV